MQKCLLIKLIFPLIAICFTLTSISQTIDTIENKLSANRKVLISKETKKSNHIEFELTYIRFGANYIWGRIEKKSDFGIGIGIGPSPNYDLDLNSLSIVPLKTTSTNLNGIYDRYYLKIFFSRAISDKFDLEYGVNNSLMFLNELDDETLYPFTSIYSNLIFHRNHFKIGTGLYLSGTILGGAFLMFDPIFFRISF